MSCWINGTHDLFTPDNCEIIKLQEQCSMASLQALSLLEEMLQEKWAAFSEMQLGGGGMAQYLTPSVLSIFIWGALYKNQYI